MKRIAAIEGGGTKFVVGIVLEDGSVISRHVIDTTTPEETMEQVVEFLKQHEFDVIGLGTFGPIDPNKESETYGYITTTPKVKWTNFDIVGYLENHFDCKIGFDTDVNGAALGELLHGAAKGYDSCVYVTIGTGIGAGVVVNKQMVNGLLHPEVGHMLVRQHEEDTYEGNCAYHKNCLEGLACGPAIESRVNKKAYELSADDKVWEFESYYLAQMIMNLILVVSPEKIILGGGVMKQSHLFDMIRKDLKELMNGYIKKDVIYSQEYIVSPKLGDNAGLIGAAMIGLQELTNE